MKCSHPGNVEMTKRFCELALANWSGQQMKTVSAAMRIKLDGSDGPEQAYFVAGRLIQPGL